MFDKFKEDTRPPKDGWATGLYTCNCRTCKEDYLGEKRSSMCADCAYDPKLNLERKLKQLIYTVDGMCCEYRNMNYGNAQEWLRHIDKAYSDYQEAEDELEENK